MASRTDADRDRDPDPGPEAHNDEIDEWIEILGTVLAFFALPPFFLYRDRSSWVDRIWLWRYFYVAFALGTMVMFAPQLLAGEYGYLLAIPVFYLVAIYTVVGPLILMLLRSRDVAFTVPSSLPVPEGVVLPEFSLAAAGTGVAVVLVGAVLFVFGKPGSLKWDMKHASLGPDEFIVPLDEITNKKDDAHPLPVLVATVSTLVLGESGAGKTTSIRTMLDQVPFGDEIATVVHEFKDDYKQYFEDRGIEYIVLSIEDSDVIWNMFLDVTRERHYREIASAMMGDADGNDPFHQPATSVLRAAMVYLHREGQNEGTTPTHEDLKELLARPREELHSILADAGIQGAEQIDANTGGASNVYNHIHERVDPLFEGDFGKAGSFSLREWAENPNGRALVADNRTIESDTLGPMLRLVLDEAIRYSLDAETETNYILDEIDELPPLKRLSTAASAGRDEGVRALVGIQTVGQLRAQYGKDTNGILGNCVQGIYFGPGESETVEYILDALGKYREAVTSRTRSNNRGNYSSSATTHERDRAPITSGELRDMDSGDAVVENRSEWWIGTVAKPSRIRKWL
jgi:hypothetical protein